MKNDNMTAKEKAKELFEKFYIVDNIDVESYISFLSAKQCALISVDEILSFIEDERNRFNWKIYYQEVKKEIEKL